MKTKVLLCVIICLFLFTGLQADEKEFGFTGKFKQVTLKKFPYGTIPEFPLVDPYSQGKTVRALMVGLAKYDAPDQPDWEIYYFYSYHWPNHSEWWVGFVVVNYGDREISCDITMQIKGPKKDSITRKAVLQPSQATLFTAEVDLADKVGLYTLIGKITGGAKDKVKTRCYIYEIW